MKGMILAAGYGTRFLPATKTIPKEMLPLVDRPAIDFIVREFIKAGIKEILVVTSRRKKSLEDYLDREIELETQIDDTEKLEKIQAPHEKYEGTVRIYFIRQQDMRGTGHAVLLGKNFCNTPFVLAFPDDIVFSKIPLAKQLIEAYNQTKKSVLAVMDMAGKDVSQYGVVEPAISTRPDKTFDIHSIIEKPKPGTEPSSMISIGRYLLTPDIFPLIEEGYQENGDKEYYLTDALNSLASQKQLVAHEFTGKRHDTGTPIGYIQAITEYALSRKDLRESYIEYLKEMI